MNGERLTSAPATNEYRDNWDRIFKFPQSEGSAVTPASAVPPASDIPGCPTPVVVRPGHTSAFWCGQSCSRCGALHTRDAEDRVFNATVGAR